MITADPGLNPLLTAAVPTLYVHNAFRLTGLQVTASTREVARYGDRLKLLHEVGGQAAADLAALRGDTQAPGPEDLRNALRSLRDIRARTLHEFFWLWPDDWERPEADAAFAALKQSDLKAAKAIWTAREAERGCCIAIHNLAVLGHMRALDLSLRDLESALPPGTRNEMHAEWRMAMIRWGRIAVEEELWDIYRARIIQINDLSVTTGLARRLHEDLLWALDRIIAMMAVAYAERKRRIECQWHIAFLKSHLGEDEAAFHKAMDHALIHVRERLDNAIQNAKRQTQAEEMEGIAKARVLLDTSAALLKVVEMVETRQGNPDCEKIGRGALDIAVAGYNLIYCAKDPPPAVLARRGERKHAEHYLQIMARSRSLTNDTDLHRIIDSNIKIAEELLQRMPPELNLAPPKKLNARDKVVVDAGQRPRWSTFFLHCLRIVPRGVWILILIISLSTGVSFVVNAISSKPIATGKFTPAEMKALGLPQRLGTQALIDVPKTGVLQRSPALQNDDSRLQISAPVNHNGTHFCVILTLLLKPHQSLKLFIRNGEKADIGLPDDIYMITLTWGTYWSIVEERFQPLHQDKFSPSLLPTGMPAVLQIISLPNGEFHIKPAS